jgi:hypothetical protein
MILGNPSHNKGNEVMAKTTAKNEKTSKSVASTASKLLKDPSSATKKEIKQVAASALTQAENKKPKK